MQPAAAEIEAGVQSALLRLRVIMKMFVTQKQRYELRVNEEGFGQAVKNLMTSNILQ